MRDNGKSCLLFIKKNKIIIQSIVWFPVLEEIIFRFFIYQYCELFDFSNIQYILLATFSFVIAHIFYQGVSSIVKILF
ncbi:TPA: CPBP family glutamic-type intramembrane protease, partial [Listeria monocytogenes]